MYIELKITDKFEYKIKSNTYISEKFMIYKTKNLTNLRQLQSTI